MPRYRVRITRDHVVSRDFDVDAADPVEAAEIAEEESANTPGEWADELASLLPTEWVTKVERIDA